MQWLPRNRDKLGYWLNEAGLVGTGVEVGTYYGQFAEQLLDSWEGRLIGVDPYRNDSMDVYRDGCNQVQLEKVMGEALAKLRRFGSRFRLIQKPSVEASAEFKNEELDLVYIDANHKFESVLEDITAWWPKLKSGGMFGGHDYYTRHDEQQWCDVPGAVKEFFEPRWLTPHLTDCTSWWVQKP